MSERPAEDRLVDELIERSLGGDQDAFSRLVELKRNLVFRVAWQQLGDPEEARAAAQAVFVRLWRNLHRFDRSRRFDTWLYRLTVNAAIDRHRRRRVRPQTGLDEVFESMPAAEPGGGFAAERDLQLAEVQRILHELTSLLPEKQRQAFLLREVEGVPTAEVAAVLRTTESTVRNHVFQARKLLREELVARYPEYAGTVHGGSS